MDADITQELAVIKSQPGGNAVKTAIRSALSKLAETRGGTVVQEFEAGQGYDTPVGLIDACVDGIESVLYVQNNDDIARTSTTLEFDLSKAACLLVIAMHRDTPLSISGDGWATLVQNGPSDSNDQRVTIFQKVVSSGHHTVTLSQNSSVRLTAKVVILDSDATVTVTSSEIKNDVTSFAFPTPTGSKRLYISSSSLANNTTNEYASLPSIDPDVSMDETRLSVWYYGETHTETVEVTYYASPSTGYFNAIALDIT